MNNQPRIPDPETAKRLLANLRQTHLEMCEFNRELDGLQLGLNMIFSSKG